ncbi:hypothetical protein DIPPA_00390 [Diplonema papillatum]|nr:hypothetical protein DIPPA_00390 [Diplonema papillatum]
MELPFANASQGEASKYAEDLFSFLEDHNAIHSMHPEDYFAELPKMSPRLQEWTQSLGSVIADSPGFEAVPHLLQVEDTTTPPWWTVLERAPEVLAFARRCVQLRLNRDVEVDPAKCVRFDGAPTPGVPELARKRLHRLTDGMKSKKQHEVGQMCWIEFLTPKTANL